MALDALSLRSTQGSLISFKSIYSQDSKSLDNTVLYHELRLIERNENEINVCWKGAHMMLYFMAFVFGALCTCCFHRLMYMFDEKCVLFPKVVSHASIHRIVYDFFSYKPQEKLEDVVLTTDYVSTQWADNSVCYLPTYVPLVSGLAGLVWTTMFLMCSSGTSNITGAQRHWRALPVMFFFSITMAVLCIYASTITHRGLRELCEKLAEATGSPSCGYSINVATLVYEGRIRGVYQATRLCIASAWLHTGCWLLSALLILARVLLAVDFTLVQVKAQLIGNLDDMLQKHEKQIDSYNAESETPLRFDIDEDESEVELFATTNTTKSLDKTALETALDVPSKSEPISQPAHSLIPLASSPSIAPEDRRRLLDKYIDKILHDLLKNIAMHDQETQTKIRLDTNTPEEATNSENTEKLALEFMQKLHEKLTQEFNELEHQIRTNLQDKDDNRTEVVPKSDDEKNKGLKKTKDKENIVHEKKNQVSLDQDDKIGATKLYEPNIKQNTSKKSIQENNNKRDSKQLHIQFYSKPESDSVKITDENTIDNKVRIDQDSKDKDIEHINSPEKRNVRENALHTSDVDDKTALLHKTTAKYEEKEIEAERKISEETDKVREVYIADNDDKSALENDKVDRNEKKKIESKLTTEKEKDHKLALRHSEDDKSQPEHRKPDNDEKKEAEGKNTENKQVSLHVPEDEDDKSMPQREKTDKDEK